MDVSPLVKEMTLYTVQVQVAWSTRKCAGSSIGHHFDPLQKDRGASQWTFVF